MKPGPRQEVFLVTCLLLLMLGVQTITVATGPKFVGLIATLSSLGAVLFLIRRAYQFVQATDQMHAQFERDSVVDALTGLPNRSAVIGELDERLRDLDRSRGSQSLLVVVLNVDSFAQINDSIGPFKADRLLRAIAGRLRGILPESDYLARLDGDEFAVISPMDYIDMNARDIAERLLASFDDKFAISRRTIAVSASVGFIVVNDFEEAEEVIRSARWALREAKRAGKNRVRSVDEAFEAETRELVELEDDLREAIASNMIGIHFQPLVHPNGDVFAYECLARWERRPGERVAPDKFFAVAERIGLSSRLGEQVLKKACKTLAKWQEEFGEEDLSISVNFSADEIGADEFTHMVRTAVTKAGIRPQQLIVEVSDATAGQLFDGLHGALTELSNIGIRIALDDFGSGFYTLNNLDKLPVNIIKIDREFVNSALVDERSKILFEYLVKVAGVSSDYTVAEGVESEEQRQFALDAGIDLVQGYHVAAPMSATDAESFRGKEKKVAEPPSPERLASEFTGFAEALKSLPLYSDGVSYPENPLDEIGSNSA